MGLLILATLQNGSHKACEEWLLIHVYNPQKNILQKSMSCDASFEVHLVRLLTWSHCLIGESFTK